MSRERDSGQTVSRQLAWCSHSLKAVSETRNSDAEENQTSKQKIKKIVPGRVTPSWMQTTQSVAALVRRTRRRARTVTRNAIYTWSCIQLQHSLTRYLRQYSMDYSLSSGFRVLVIGILVSALLVYKSSSLQGYFDCFQSNHIVGCWNINFSDLPQIRREKFCFASKCLYFFVVLFCTTAGVSLQRLANFSPCDPLIFCFSPTRYAHSLLKNEFFSNIHGWFLREEQRKRNFQANEVSKRRSKKSFFTLFCVLNQNFFAVPVRHRSETCKEKASLLLIKE